MSALSNSWVPAEARQTWKNLQICQVQDAGTLWVREVQTDFMSQGLREFQQMEKQMNSQFKRRPPGHSFPQFPAKVGSNVVVHLRGYWYRGRVESILDCNKDQEAEIFLVDYGMKVKTNGSSVVCLHPDEWMSVPYQARQIHLFGILPLSLKYVFTALELKIIPRESMKWDKSATDFVRKLFQLKPYAEFTPVLFDPDGCTHGLLTVHLTKEFWDVIPHFSSLHHLQPQEGSASLDLAKILVACDFATLETNKVVEMLETWEKEKNVTMRNAEKNEQQTDSPLCRLDQMVLPSSKPFSQFSQMVRSKTSAEDFHETTDRKEELGLMSRSVSRGRGLMSFNLAPCGHSTPLPAHYLDNPQNSSTVCRSSGVSPASNSSHPHSDLFVNNLQTLAELKSTSNDILSIEEIPSPSYGTEKLISRLVQAPVIKVPASNLEKSPKFSFKTENDGEKIDGTSGNRAKKVFPDVQNDIGSSCLDACTGLTTTDNKFEVVKNVIRIPSVYENDKKMSPKIPPQETHPQPPVRGSGRGILKFKVENSHFWADSSENSHIRSNGLGKQDWDSGKELEILDQEKNIMTLRNEKTLLDIDVFDKANRNLGLRKNEIGGNDLIQPSEAFCQDFRSYSNLKNHMKVGAKNIDKTDIPKWVCKRLLDVVSGAEHPRHREMGISVEDISVLTENCLSKVDENHEEKLMSVDKAEVDHRVDELLSTDLSEGTGNGKKYDKGKSFDESLEREGIRQLPNEQNEKHDISPKAFFMSDTRDIWTNELACDLEEGEFAPILSETHITETPNIAKMFRVFVAGESPIAEEEVIVNESMTYALLNSHIVKVLSNAGMRATQLQAYTWPAITRGSSAIIVGGRSCGKTLGYVIPLLSTILDTWQHINRRLIPGIGAVMVVVCKDWRSAKCVADYIVNFLPDDCTLKIMTAWGGCGHEETKDTKVQLLGGCDILITTAPCLLRLLMGKSVAKSKDLDGENRDTPSTSLARCCHLIIDDADSILENCSCEIKQLLTLWGEGKKGCGRGDLVQQIILVSSRWTNFFDSLTHTLIPLMDPTVIVSAPGEAAVGARIANQFHLVLDEDASLEKVVELIQNFCRHKKNLVFVIDDLVAEKLKAMLESAAIYSLSVYDTTVMWNLQLIVQEWHMTKAVTMIVCKGAEHYLLTHDLNNADAIFHTYITQTKFSFMLRYGFMVDKFSTDLRQESLNCESHLIVSKKILQSDPSVLNGLDRLFDIPEEIFLGGSFVSKDKPYQYSALCYYLKAYGKCPVAPNCEFRHEVRLSDIPNGLPRMGEVTFDIVKVLNASRYLVRLTEYREKAGDPSLDLRKHYLTLFLALQQHFADPAKHETIKCAELGMLCAVKDEDIWARAQVVRVNYSKNVPLIVVFLVDEGKELRVELSAAFNLPPYLAAMPELIAEVYLCRIQPMDHDREWTLQASQYVNDIFTCGNTRFVGRIALALGLTLWLSPVTEFAQVGKALVQKGSLRARLIAQGFGIDNPSHLEKLEHLCSKATISLDYQNLCESDWKCVIQNGYELCNSHAEKDSCINMLKHDKTEDVDKNDVRVEMQTYEKEEKLVSNTVADAYLDKDRLSCIITQEGSQFIQDTKSSSRSNVTPIQLACQDLPLAIEVRVEIGEIESPDRFFVLREDKFDRLDCLELQLENLTQHSEPSIMKADTEDPHWDKGINIPPFSYCIAKFTDDKYYRGLVESHEPDGRKRVHYVDHGETLLLQNHQIHAYPVGLLEELPAQAIPCTLAHIIIPANVKEEATRVMSQLADATDIWTVKVVEIQETADEQIYSVELSDNSCNPPKEMWRELVGAGLAVHKDQQQMVETDDEGSLLTNPINVSHIEDKEAVDFLLNIPSIKTHLEKKKWLSVQQLPKEIHRKEKPLYKNMQLPLNHASSPDLHHMLNPSLRDKKGDDSKKAVVSGEVMKKENGRQGESSLIRLEKDIGSIEQCDLVSDHLCDGSPKKVVWQKKHVVKVNKRYRNQRASDVATNAFNEMCLTVPPLEAVEGITSKLFPETSWCQTEDSVVVNIHLIGVERYKCCLRSSHLTFMTLLGESFYVFDETLERDIDVERSVLRLRGTCVSLTLQKAVKEKWDSLLANRERRPLLRVEYQALSSDDDQSSESEKDADWTRAVMDSPMKEYGGLPAGISDSDISCDELSDGDEFIS